MNLISTIPDKRVGTQSKFSPLSMLIIRCFFSFFVGKKHDIFQHLGGKGDICLQLKCPNYFWLGFVGTCGRDITLKSFVFKYELSDEFSTTIII